MWVNPFDALPANGNRMVLWSSSHQTTNTNNIEFGIRKTGIALKALSSIGKMQKNSGQSIIQTSILFMMRIF